MNAVPLGFEVGTGAPVEIPIRNMVVCGQTQEAGKTTALEALITRAGVRAVTFVTKRGEASFTDARRITPYYRERTDWQSVAAILEASRGEKLKFERPWIIRASKGARTLGDVHRNVRKAMETAKGLAGDVYLTLDAYLEVVVPAIAAVRWAPRLELASGVNAVDLTTVPGELQHLVIRSSIDWVLEHEADTIVVIPEAWKFVPQGRGTPVKHGAAALIRQGSGLRDYVWLDSQDIGGVEKEILRSCPVWLLGVQREANEIKRTLDNIPASVAKPSKADIATLELGQFYACWGRHAVKTYVQPAWMDAAQAGLVAQGVVSVSQVLRQRRSIEREAAAVERTVIGRSAHPAPKENDVNAAEAERLKTENTTLKRENEVLKADVETLSHRLQRLEVSNDTERQVAKAEARRLPDIGAAAVTPVRQLAGAGRTFTAEETFDNERLYQAFKARLIAEAPGLVRMLVTVPEIEMTIARKTLTLDEYSLKGRIARMLKDGFFRDPRGPGAVRTALKRTGPDANTANIGRALDDFTKDGFVTDEGSGYREVAGMKINILEG